MSQRCFQDDPYVDHSGFLRSLSDTGSGPLHTFPRSYTEYCSSGLCAQTRRQTHTQTLGLNSVYTNIHRRSDLQHVCTVNLKVLRYNFLKNHSAKTDFSFGWSAESCKGTTWKRCWLWASSKTHTHPVDSHTHARTHSHTQQPMSLFARIWLQHISVAWDS